MIDPQTYATERAICDKAHAYAERVMCNGGARRVRNYLTAEEAAHPDYASCDNAMRGRVDQFDLLRDLPERFDAYLQNDAPDGVGARLDVTVWTGDRLGSAVVHSVARRRGFASDRQRYGRATINGVAYAWQGPGAGMYARFRKLGSA